MDPVTVTCVRNPFDPAASREIRALAAGRPLPEYWREFFPVAPVDTRIAVSVNGRVLAGPDQAGFFPGPGDSVVFCAVPQGGGGGGGKDVLATVALLAVVVGAAYAGPAVAGWLALEGTAFTVVSSLVAAGTIAAGGLLVNSFLPRAQIDTGGPVESPGNSPTYSWEARTNALAEGLPLPVIYGTHRITPPLIGRYVETTGDKQYLNLLFAVAGHSVSSISGVETNGTPISRYKGAKTGKRLGSVNQAPLQYFRDTKFDTSIQAKLSTGWTTRETQGNAVQGLGVGISLPQGLFYANDKGGLDSQTVKVHIEFQKTGASSWTRLKSYNTSPIVIESGRWSGGYEVPYASQWIEIEAGPADTGAHYEGERYSPPAGTWYSSESNGRIDYEWRWVVLETEVKQPGTVAYDYITITAGQRPAIRRIYYRDSLAEGQYQVRVRLAEATPSGSRYSNDVYFEYLQEIVYDDFSYPGVALLSVRALATDQLSGAAPRVTCTVKRSVVPIWTGSSYQYKSAGNPAWACYDILHNDVYGGDVPTARIQYSDFASWASWCSAQDYHVNLYLDSAASLRRVLDTVSILGRGSVVQMGSRFTCLVDRPAETPVQKFLFTVGNIIADSFQEEFLAMDDRANAVEITCFPEESDNTRQTISIYADDFNTTAQEISQTQITLFGCTDRDMAAMFGRAALNRNRYLTLTASWDADVDALACMPGDVIDVQHDVPQWGYGGRVVSATASTVTLDKAVTLEPGVDYALTIQHADDTREDVNVQGVSEETETDTLTIIGAWANGTPALHDLYSFGRVNAVSKLMRVVKITRSQEMRRRVTALEYVPEVYADSVDIPDAESDSDLAGVAGLAAREVWALGPDGSGRSVLDLSWRGAALIWHAFIRPSGADEWTYLGETLHPFFSVETPLTAGVTYDVAVAGTRSPEDGQTQAVTILGKLAPPSDVENFLAYQKGDEILFRWDHVPDVDVWGYEIRRGAAWETGLSVVDGAQPNVSAWKPPLDGTYKFWIKAKDESGIYSINAASSQITVDISGAINIVVEQDEIPDEVSSGTLEDMIYLPTPELIAWLPGMTDTDFEGTEVDTDISAYAGDSVDGVYTSQVYDLGEIADFTLRLDAEFSATARNVTDATYPDRTDQSFPSDTDTSITSLSVFTPEYRVSEDNVDWSDWERWTGPVDCYARYWQVRVTTDVDALDTYFAFSQVSGLLDVTDKEITAENQAIASAGTTFTLSSLGIQILQQYYVGVTVLGTSALYPVTNKQSAQFTVRLFNSGGAGTAGSVDFVVRGF